MSSVVGHPCTKEQANLDERAERGTRLGAHGPEALPPRVYRLLRHLRRRIVRDLLFEMLLLPLLRQLDALQLEAPQLILQRHPPLLVRRRRDQPLDLMDLANTIPCVSDWDKLVKRSNVATCASTSTSSSLTAAGMDNTRGFAATDARSPCSNARRRAPRCCSARYTR